MVAPLVGCSVELVNSAGEMMTRNSIPLSSAMLKGNGAETMACNYVSGCVVLGISARGPATTVMLPLTGAIRAMTSTGETKTGDTQLVSLSSGSETGSTVPGTGVEMEETFIVALEILAEVSWTGAEMGKGASCLTTVAASWRFTPGDGCLFWLQCRR